MEYIVRCAATEEKYTCNTESDRRTEIMHKSLSNYRRNKVHKYFRIRLCNGILL